MGALLGDRFELSEQVGAGGFGTVYRALDRLDGGLVALKILHSTSATDAGRFDREATLLAELHHPSVVRYIAHGRVDGKRGFLAMEWLEGHTLAARLTTGWLSLSDLITLAARVVDGLAAVAQRGMIHRDVKPGNLFLPGGRIQEAKILDFGLARRMSDYDSSLSRTGALLGTPHYMSPEQARGVRNLDSRTDIFSLGSVLYECLCGVSPFEGDTALAVLGKICFEHPARVESLRARVPHELVSLLERMLLKDAQHRPPYAELAQALPRLARSLAEAESQDGISLALDTRELVVSSSPRPSLRTRVQQRVLSVLFVGPSEEHSERALRQMLDVLLDRYGARCERILDGSLILMLERYTSPHEQAIAAAHCALALRDLLPDSPIALCTGKALLEGQLLVGNLLENGARLLRDTRQGMVRVDEASAGMLEGRFDLRGVQGRRFLECERSGGEAPRTLLGRVTPFVGRERELAQMELVFRECMEERVARAILVTAPAGAGKSRLRFEFAQRLRRGDSDQDYTLLSGSGDSVRTGAPFAALSPILHSWANLANADSLERKGHKLHARMAELMPQERAASVADFIGEMLGLSLPAAPHSELASARKAPQQMADRMLASWLERLNAMCSSCALVLMVDDLHWADPASVSFLEAGLRALEQQALLVLAFARPEARERFPKLWVERNLSEIRLTKLPNKACERLLAGLPEAKLGAEQKRWLIERADGNPFFLEELIRGGHAGDGDALPDSVLATIQARLDVLGEDAKLLLRIASVFGQHFRSDGVAALLGEEAARFDLSGWLRVLIERELVFARGMTRHNEYSFRHALVRDAAYALLVERERQLAHCLAADWLAAHGSAEPALLAEHFERGGDLVRAAEAYGVAVEHAFEASPMDEVIRLGARAEACGAHGPAFGEASSMIAEAFSWLQNNTEAQRRAARCKQSLAPGAPGWWRACQVLAISHLRQGENQAAEPIVDEMRAHFSPSAPSSEETIALCYVAQNVVHFQQRELGLEVLAVLERVEYSPRAQPEIEWVKVQLAIQDGDLAEALARGARALQAARHAGAVQLELYMCNNLSWYAGLLGAYEEAKAHLRAALQHPRASSVDRCFLLQNLGLVELRSGQLPAAEAPLLDSVEGFKQANLPDACAWSLSHLAELRLAGGDLVQAKAFCTEALQIVQGPEQKAYAFTICAQVQLALGSREEALASVRQAQAILEDKSFADHAVLSLLVRAECLMAAQLRVESEHTLREAHRMVRESAERLQDPTLRQVFLERVPHNARVLQLAREWLGL